MKYATTIMETIRETYNKQQPALTEENNKENKPSNMTRRDSTNSINNNTQQQIPKLMKSSSMQKM